MPRTADYLPFWASHAERWLNCPGEPYVTRAAMEAPRVQRPYTRDGILAHAIRAGLLSDKSPREFLKPDEIPEGSYDTWLDHEQFDYVKKSVEQAKMYVALTGQTLYVEKTIPLLVHGEKINCKIDQLGVGENSVSVTDYKHGAGLPVRIEGNPQLGIYALAARKLYPGKHISVAIDQPRTGIGAPQFQALDDDYLDTLRANLSAAVRRTRGLQYGELGFQIGPWCRFCDGHRGYCPKILEMVIRIPKDEPASCAPWWVLEVGDQIIEWVKGVKSEAYNAVSAGRKIPGWGIREVKGRRSWSDPEHVASILSDLTGLGVSEFENRAVKPKGITDSIKLAKSHGVSMKQLNELIYTPYTKKLVRIDENEENPEEFKFGKVE